MLHQQAAIDMAPTFDPAAYGFVKHPQGSMDLRHVRWIAGIARAGLAPRAIDIGILTGWSAAAYIPALQAKAIQWVQFADVAWQQAAKDLLVAALQGFPRSDGEPCYALEQYESASILDSVTTGELMVTCDGNHDWDYMRLDTARLLRIMPRVLIAHDSNWSACQNRRPHHLRQDGASFLKAAFQEAGYLCIEDCAVRDGEWTDRGLFVACRDLAAWEAARGIYAVTCGSKSL